MTASVATTRTDPQDGHTRTAFVLPEGAGVSLDFVLPDGTLIARVNAFGSATFADIDVIPQKDSGFTPRALASRVKLGETATAVCSGMELLLNEARNCYAVDFHRGPEWR
jgi:hypothetical protein